MLEPGDICFHLELVYGFFGLMTVSVKTNVIMLTINCLKNSKPNKPNK